MTAGRKSLGAILAPAEFPQIAGEAAAKATSQWTPKIIAMRNPVYPFELRKRGVQAVVIVEYIVKADGSVLIERVLNSPDSLFDTAIIRAATEWRFEPNIVDGRPVNTRMRVPITFKL
jgi:protein TonB